MPKPVCSQSKILGPCYLTPGAINPRQQKAYKIYANILELASIGGVDYTGRFTLLLADAASLGCGMLEPDREAARVQIALNNATAAGASVPATLNALQAKANCIVEWNDQQLSEVEMLLECALGKHSAQT